MRRALLAGGLVGLLFLVSATRAKADETLDYTLMVLGSTTPLATWEMSQMPTPTCPASTPPAPCFVSAEFFAENVNLSLDGGPATPDTLVFLNSTFTDVDLNDLNFSIPEFVGQQLYTGDESAPTMSIGSFLLTDDGTNGVAGTNYTLDVSIVPEPSSFLLLATGLICVAAGLRRRWPLI